jgi:hemerythrin superfamily protein
MSIIDKALGAITPPESDQARAEATQKARAAATQGDWLSLALDHHDEIRSAFEACRKAADGSSRLAAMKRLALVLNGHSLAEEIVLYPALAKAGEKVHAGQAYTEQTTAKMQMAELERIDPDGQPWLDKVEHIRGAVLHHMYEEEKSWFPELKEKYDNQQFLTSRFREEFERYAGAQGDSGAARSEPRAFEDPFARPSEPPSAAH